MCNYEVAKAIIFINFFNKHARFFLISKKTGSIYDAIHVKQFGQSSKAI